MESPLGADFQDRICADSVGDSRCPWERSEESVPGL